MSLNGMGQRENRFTDTWPGQFRRRRFDLQAVATFVHLGQSIMPCIERTQTASRSRITALDETLTEEKAAGEALTELAETAVNQRTAAA